MYAKIHLIYIHEKKKKNKEFILDSSYISQNLWFFSIELLFESIFEVTDDDSYLC